MRANQKIKVMQAKILNIVNQLKLAGVDVTATATELSALHSQGAVAADFAKLHAVTVTAAQVNRVDTGVDGLGFLRVARFTFDASIAANQSVAAHGVGVTIPAQSVVVGGFVEVNTLFTSANGNNGTIAIMVEGANDVISATAVSGAPYSSIGRKPILPKANTPESSSIKVTTAKEITCTVAVSALTAGKLTGYLYYVEGVASA